MCLYFLQGGYDGTHFLAKVEVYDPIKDAWEDGVSLTSGRSGLASAVIYQPSIPGSYSHDCITNLSQNREYDDRGGSEGHEDDHDLMSQGNRSSYHVNLSSNYYSGKSGGNMENIHPTQCEQLKNIKLKIFRVLKEFNQRFNGQCLEEKSTRSVKNSSLVSRSCTLLLFKKRLKQLVLNEKIKSQKKIKAD